MSRSEVSLSKTGKVNIESCKAGDLVVVLWDPNHESFQILQENKHMYFLHSDYLEVLGLEVVDGKPNKFYCTGVVIDKEYCHARKVRITHIFCLHDRSYFIIQYKLGNPLFLNPTSSVIRCFS